jgi:hypothetical protein
MFKGNPRKPGSHSFENIQFVLDEERMSRLRSNWKARRISAIPNDRDTSEDLNDEFMVAHLSSDSMTGLRHEINVLISMHILSIQENGRIVLVKGWEDRVPHMMLIEMQKLWGTDVDTNNLYCIHDTIKLSLENHWEHYEDEGWRRIEDDDNNDELAFDDVEYQLREKIFTENYYNWVNEKSGMGEFGI